MPRSLAFPALIAALTAAWVLSAPNAFAGEDASGFQLPEPGASGPAQPLWATHYFVHAASATPTGLPFKDKSGNVVSDNVSPRDWCAAAIEGTVQVTFNAQPRTLNYAGLAKKSQVDCAAVLKIDPVKKPWITSVGRSYFAPAGGPYGDGVKGYRLVPFRTIAVDNTVLPFGTVVYVARARGVSVTLPSGTVVQHDGYFFAGDTGGAIKGRHIDVFCGTTSANCFPGFIASDEARTFEARVVTDSAVVEALRALHKPAP